MKGCLLASESALWMQQRNICLASYTTLDTYLELLLSELEPVELEQIAVGDRAESCEQSTLVATRLS